MSRRLIVIGLAAICATALGVIPASSGAAGFREFTCIPGGGAHNTNTDCEVSSAGTSGHVAITPGTTEEKWDFQINPKIMGKLFGATVELEGTGYECIECTTENKEVGGVWEATGSGQVALTGVTVVGLSKCTVTGGTITTKSLKSVTVSASGTKFEPETGTTLAVFSITGSECAVAASNLKLTGKFLAEANGASCTLNVTKASGELALEGEKASFKGKFTRTIGVPKSGMLHPASFTAV